MNINQIKLYLDKKYSYQYKPKKCKHDCIHKSNKRETLNCTQHKYKNGNLVMFNKPGLILQALFVLHEGPFKIVKHHNNKSIIIEYALYKE